MSTINVREPHSLGIDEARRRIGSFEDMLAKYGVKATWKGNRADIKGTGVSGDITVSDADVAVTVKLGMMAKAIGVKPDKLEGSIRKRLREAFDA